MNKPVMVVGGGIAGIQASFDLAEMGIPVFLVESSPSIGGRMAQLDKTFPTNDCSACILAPKVTECYNHPLVKTLAYSEVMEIKGKSPDFTVAVKKKPRYVKEETCTGCGDCFDVCPFSANSEFEMGIGKRKAIYKPFAQAVPNKAIIDKSVCRLCRKCDKVCKAAAIDHEQTEQILEIPVSSVIFATGYDASKDIPPEFGYSEYQDVVTSLEFERIMCASGPYGGHIQRPSDGREPKSVAFVQCVGSRDHQRNKDYCSSVCCMYAVKEAMITKEHLASVETVDIFYMDMRAFGKDFDKYIDSAKSKYNIGFVKSRISNIERDNETGDLIVSHVNGSGSAANTPYDMVVLSVGMNPKAENVKLFGDSGVRTDKYGFITANEFHYPVTSRDGIFACGVAAGVKDIPETVIEASAAAASAAKVAKLTETDLYKDYGDFFYNKAVAPERDVSKEPIKIGVFVCHCGVNIGGYLSVADVVEYSKNLPFVVHSEEFLYACSVDSQAVIAEKIIERGINRVVVASCTPRTHEPLFRGVLESVGLNPYLLAMANIRDQCSWVHMDDKDIATVKAKELVRMAVGKVTAAKQLTRNKIDVTSSALVIGGGVAGMTSALELAGMGYQVFLAEQTDKLGGNALQIATSNLGRPVPRYIDNMIGAVKKNPLIQVFLCTTVELIDGYVGNFTTKLKSGGEATDIQHGAVIIAVGASEQKPTEYLYGQSANVCTMLEFEQRVKNNFKELDSVKNVVIIQCVGSREGERQYCSRVCCNQAIKNAIRLKEHNRDMNVTILYRDIRTYGLNELNYRTARSAGITFIRYDADKKPVVTEEPHGALAINVFDELLGAEVCLPAELLLLSSAIVQNAANNKNIAQMLKVPLNAENFFLEAHVKLRPVDFATEGVYVCGIAHAPKNIKESIIQGKAAAARAGTVLAKEWLVTEGTIAGIDGSYCSACGACERVCAYKAIEIKDVQAGRNSVRRAVINDVLCKGCGTCAAACRCGAIDINGFSDKQVLNEIEYLLRRS